MSSIVRIIILVTKVCVVKFLNILLFSIHPGESYFSFRLQLVAQSLKCVLANRENNQLRPQITWWTLITRSKMGSYMKPVGVSYWTGGRSKQRRTLKEPLCRWRLWCYRLFSVRYSPFPYTIGFHTSLITFTFHPLQQYLGTTEVILKEINLGEVYLDSFGGMRGSERK